VPTLRAHNISVSLDGFMAGPHQDLEHPLGVGGHQLHEWAIATRTFQRTHGSGTGSGSAGPPAGTNGVDDAFIARGDDGVGATIMGRNMFGPVRGPWPDESWTGWWGENPPYHHPVFVLTHHARPPVTLRGGTTFHFVTDGIKAALQRAFDAAGGRDVRLGGGASTIQQYLRAGLLDLLHVAIAPILLGAGERLFDHLGAVPVGYTCTDLTSSAAVAHVTLARATPSPAADLDG
jgi:dihydrofolate reductase